MYMTVNKGRHLWKLSKKFIKCALSLQYIFILSPCFFWRFLHSHDILSVFFIHCEQLNELQND